MTQWRVLRGVGVCLAWLTLALVGSMTPAFAGQDTVIYIGAADCKYCREWEARYEHKFKEMCAARNVKFRGFQVATIRNIRDERYWPNDLKPLLAKFSSRTGSPHFLAIADGQVIVDTHGIVNWQKLILPLVE